MGDDRNSHKVPVEDQKYEIIPPVPYALAESLRAFGYSLSNAISDIIDNSIAALATIIEVDFWWENERSYIRIYDDGLGMNEKVLSDAMRLGTKNPLETRDPTDLGRFGLGLKTASFSQCRRLTVRSKGSEGKTSTRCWDLDFVREKGDWALLVAPMSYEDETKLGTFSDERTGTVVLWQKLDKIMPTYVEDENKAQGAFLESVKEVEGYLGMVFHRFLTGKEAITLKINGRQIEPWDPFLLNNQATQLLPTETFGKGNDLVEVRPYVLPHRSRIKKDVAFKSAAGPKGWNSQQGFYVYRNKRLIVPGSWLGLYRQEDLYRLARIQIDIGNTLDLDWGIDVRKARAIPPNNIRIELKRIASATRSRASEVYRHRGKRIRRDDVEKSIDYVWEPKHKANRTTYTINREHPLVKRLLEFDSNLNGFPNLVLRLIEETIPISHIIGVFSKDGEQQDEPFSGSEEQVFSAILASVKVIMGMGLNPIESEELMLSMEPFNSYPGLVKSAITEFNAKGDDSE